MEQKFSLIFILLISVILDFWRGGVYDTGGAWGMIRNGMRWTNNSVNSIAAFNFATYLTDNTGNVSVSGWANRRDGRSIRCATDRKPEAPEVGTWHPDVAGTTTNAYIQVVPESSRRSDPLPPDAVSRARPDTAARPIVVPTPPKIQESKIKL